jgi:hypothetical protein
MRMAHAALYLTMILSLGCIRYMRIPEARLRLLDSNSSQPQPIAHIEYAAGKEGGFLETSWSPIYLHEAFCMITKEGWLLLPGRTTGSMSLSKTVKCIVTITTPGHYPYELDCSKLQQLAASHNHEAQIALRAIEDRSACLSFNSHNLDVIGAGAYLNDKTVECQRYIMANYEYAISHWCELRSRPDDSSLSIPLLEYIYSTRALGYNSTFTEEDERQLQRKACDFLRQQSNIDPLLRSEIAKQLQQAEANHLEYVTAFQCLHEIGRQVAP